MRSVRRGVLILGALACVLGAGPSQGEGLDGRSIGHFHLTYYMVAQEQGQGPLPVYSADCRAVLARTGQDFHDKLSLEGTGLLADGRLVNFEQRCSCAVPGFARSRACYRVLSRAEFPWGKGAYQNDQFYWLQPFRSAAVDPDVVPIGSVLYVPELAGFPLPDGTVSNGCVRAEDTGRAIRGQHLDWFIGLAPPGQWLRQHAPPENVTAYADSRRCTRAFP